MTKVLKNDVNSSKWTATGNEMIKCPVPGCHHIGLMITKVHCRMAHGLERTEVEKKYGFPSRVIQKGLGDKRSNIPTYNRLRKSDY
ncbi:hypothetical protein [Lysinibacillus phage vB_LspM-01]|nr:hypothetical protein [Lysinibacillus phage vB_LspM-01]